MSVERTPGREPEQSAEQSAAEKSGQFFGYDVSGMSPVAQIAVGIGVLLPTTIALAAFGFALTIAPEDKIVPLVVWLTFLFLASLGWMIPAAALTVRGVKESYKSAGFGALVSGRSIGGASSEGERAVLRALREGGEMSAARAAVEASLTVAEADEVLSRLAGEGHVRLRIRGGGLFYSLWETGVDSDESGEFGAL